MRTGRILRAMPEEDPIVFVSPTGSSGLFPELQRSPLQYSYSEELELTVWYILQ
jgi:hypothetical protein